ncbi:hypothetical protein GCM10010195_65540 [Kitasatospora griseola]|nr:hypothetical protein GCM10010195_65540 [Kitasatospora griseola]
MQGAVGAGAGEALEGAGWGRAVGDGGHGGVPSSCLRAYEWPATGGWRAIRLLVARGFLFGIEGDEVQQVEEAVGGAGRGVRAEPAVEADVGAPQGCRVGQDAGTPLDNDRVGVRAGAARCG